MDMWCHNQLVQCSTYFIVLLSKYTNNITERKSKLFKVTSLCEEVLETKIIIHFHFSGNWNTYTEHGLLISGTLCSETEDNQ